MKQIFTKTFEFEVKETDSSNDGNIGVIEGYASTFGNEDLGSDIVDAGAFKKTIRDRKGKFPILLDHRFDKQIGWNLKAKEDNKGLAVEGEIQLITEDAKNRFGLAKRAKDLGTRMGLSIGYQALKYEDEEIGTGKAKRWIRHLKEIKLFEYSLVTFPMNEMAGIEDAKGLNIFSLFEKIQNGEYTIEQIQTALASIEKSKRQAADNEDPRIMQSLDNLRNVFK